MPYRSHGELLGSVKDSLPSHAQDLYREAFNNAWTNTRARKSGVAGPPGKR
jgi:cation transport regulator ChaB